MPPDPKVVKKLEAEIKKMKEGIAASSKLAKEWGAKTGPMSTSDEKIAASGAHGIHGKVSYEKALIPLRANITQAKSELKAEEEKLAKENAKK